MGKVAVTGTVTAPVPSRWTARDSTKKATSAFSSWVRDRSVDPPMMARVPIRARRLTSALAPAPTPITTTWDLWAR